MQQHNFIPIQYITIFTQHESPIQHLHECYIIIKYHEIYLQCELTLHYASLKKNTTWERKKNLESF